MATASRIVLTLWLALLCGSCTAAPAMIPAHILNEIPQARVLGAGAYTWFGLKIYDASLWVSETGRQPETNGNARFALDLQYARDLKGDRIADASVKEMKRIGVGTLQQHQAWLGKMIDIFPDVHEGTHITGINLPGQGARFYLNGALLGEVQDPEFARAFFAIWLDPQTGDKALRHALLAGASKQ